MRLLTILTPILLITSACDRGSSPLEDQLPQATGSQIEAANEPGETKATCDSSEGCKAACDLAYPFQFPEEIDSICDLTVGKASIACESLKSYNDKFAKQANLKCKQSELASIIGDVEPQQIACSSDAGCSQYCFTAYAPVPDLVITTSAANSPYQEPAGILMALFRSHQVSRQMNACLASPLSLAMFGG